MSVAHRSAFPSRAWLLPTLRSKKNAQKLNPKSGAIRFLFAIIEITGALMNVLFGTYTKRLSQGLYSAEFVNGQLLHLHHLTALSNPTYLALHHQALFSVNQNGSQGGVVCFENGQKLNEVLLPGSPPCFVDVVDDLSLVLAANYHQGTITVYDYLPGQGIQLTQTIAYGDGSHAHYVHYIPRFDEVIVCDLGLGKVLTYQIVNRRLELKHEFVGLAAQGPRHAVAHPTKDALFVFAELSSELLVFKRTASGLVLMQSVSTLPAGQDHIKSGAAIRIHPNGKFIYTSNRGHDSISVFAVAYDGHSVRLIQNVPSYGQHPRDFDLTPDGHHLIVLNRDTDNASVYAVDAQEGTLCLVQKDFWVPEAVCVVFDQS
jgi:6-phosphogluconolactonase